MQRFAVWSGWNHTWDMLAHRVSLIRVRSNQDGSAESGILGGDWSTGATWADSVGYRIHQQMIPSAAITAQFGETILSIGPDGSATGVASLGAFDADLVVLSGFEITTDIEQPEDYPSEYDPALGYTSRGFGMSVALDGNNDVVANGAVRWGPRDREDMNAAMAHADTRLTIWWTALSGIEHFENAYVVGSQELAHDPPNSEQAAVTHTLDWTEDGPGISAMSQFDLKLYDTDGGDGGDYLRSFGVEVDASTDASPPTSVSGEILTYNAIELGKMSMDLEATLHWIHSMPGTIETVTHEGIHDIGVHKFEANAAQPNADI